MFRARIDAVNGTKVFAGGKWLSCIGNKNFRVGEYIWTDGRCVYGNFQIPQQPLVITATASDDEGIPIAFSNKKLFTFKKNKLTEAGTFDYEKDNYLNSLIFVNDKKGHSFFNRGHNLWAGNIDDKGNLFRLTSDGRHPEHPVKIFIWKNDEIVNEIDLDSFRKKTLADFPYSGVPSTFQHLGKTVKSQGENIDYSEIWWAFIEDENNWAVTFSTSASTFVNCEDDAPPYYKFIEYHESNWFRDITFVRYHHMTPNSTVTLFETTSDYSSILTLTEKNIKNIKFPLQDDFFYRVTEVKGTYRSLDVSVFSPNGDEIFNVACAFDSYLLLRKINSSLFLFGIYYSDYILEENMHDGLYLFNNGVFTLLADDHCINQRLCPMKNFKGWQNRLKEF